GGDQVGVSLGAEGRARSFQFLTQLAEILDDAVVDHGKVLGGVGVRVAFGGPAVGRPAGVADSDGAGERLTREPSLKIAQLALGPPADELAAFQRGDAGGVVAPVFWPPERIHQQARDRLPPREGYHSRTAERGRPSR